MSRFSFLFRTFDVLTGSRRLKKIEQSRHLLREVRLLGSAADELARSCAEEKLKHVDTLRRGEAPGIEPFAAQIQVLHYECCYRSFGRLFRDRLWSSSEMPSGSLEVEIKKLSSETINFWRCLQTTFAACSSRSSEENEAALDELALRLERLGTHSKALIEKVDVDEGVLGTLDEPVKETFTGSSWARLIADFRVEESLDSATGSSA